MADQVMAGWVLMQHAGIKGQMRCAPSAVQHWADRGWQVVVDGDAAPPVDATKRGTTRTRQEA